ncbi:hypothetical protein [Corynebacterium sp. H130]|uniref:hypothetical protein n=1 Tax=Corynebacterium sp. H130 TaxID=3133444 RepID=UPI0030A03B05
MFSDARIKAAKDVFNKIGESAKKQAEKLNPTAAFEQAFGPAKYLAHKHVEIIYDEDPNISQADAIATLERRLMQQTAGTGAAVGAAATMPGIGTITALGGAVADSVSFLALSCAHVYGVMKVMNIELPDEEHERALVMSILLGGSNSPAVKEVAGQDWGHFLLEKKSVEVMKQVNFLLARHFALRFGTRYGVFTLGKVVPMGVGAALGGGANYLLAKSVVEATRATVLDMCKDMGRKDEATDFLEGEVVE